MRQSYKKRAKKTKRTLFFSLSLDVSFLRQGFVFCQIRPMSWDISLLPFRQSFMIVYPRRLALMAKVVFRLALLTPCVHAFVIVLVVAAGDLCYPFLIVEVG